MDKCLNVAWGNFVQSQVSDHLVGAFLKLLVPFNGSRSQGVFGVFLEPLLCESLKLDISTGSAVFTLFLKEYLCPLQFFFCLFFVMLGLGVQVVDLLICFPWES